MSNFCCKKDNRRKALALVRHKLDLDNSMDASENNFLGQLADFPSDTFENWFLKMVNRLGLGQRMDDHELNCLFEAAFAARLCNIAFNGLGGCNGAIRPEREYHRIALEQSFMAARTQLQRCIGWALLRPSRRAQVRKAFLDVSVAEENLTL